VVYASDDNRCIRYAAICYYVCGSKIPLAYGGAFAVRIWFRHNPVMLPFIIQQLLLLLSVRIQYENAFITSTNFSLDCSLVFSLLLYIPFLVRWLGVWMRQNFFRSLLGKLQHSLFFQMWPLWLPKYVILVHLCGIASNFFSSLEA
jgi:hypothetical protein